MELRQGTPVMTSDTVEIGNLGKVVIDPVSDEVTHIVVHSGILRGKDRVVPADRIEKAHRGEIRLKDDALQVKAHPEFTQDCYLLIDEDELERAGLGAGLDMSHAPAMYGYWLIGTGAPERPPSAFQPRVFRDVCTNVPEGAAVLSEGTKVVGADDREVGRVERVLSREDEPDGQVTHFIVSEGLLRKKRRLIPIEWVQRIGSDRIRLAVSSRLVEDHLDDYRE